MTSVDTCVGEGETKISVERSLKGNQLARGAMVTLDTCVEARGPNRCDFIRFLACSEEEVAEASSHHSRPYET